MGPLSQGACLIVNADDYGYFHCVSRGILRSASHGIVTATGVFANTVHFDEHAAWLRDCEPLDVGIHLNLTTGSPLTNDMRRKLSRWSGRFPGKFAMAMAILSGAIKVEEAKLEWQAQIERFLESGLRARFLNSHEHIHMLPSLLPVTRSLAKAHNITHVRYPKSRLSWSTPKGSLIRGVVMKTLEMVNRQPADVPVADFLGMEASGKLDLPSLKRSLRIMRPGRVYELMCHPGHFDAQEVYDPRLVRYHDWEAELQTLTNPAARELLDRYGVRLIGYRHLEVNDGRLVARHGSA